MTIETISVRVDPQAAQLFKTATEEQRRKLERLISFRLLEVLQTPESLEEVMRRISGAAQERGLTPELLQDILDDQPFREIVICTPDNFILQYVSPA